MFEQVLNEVTPEYNGKINLYKVNIEEEPEIAGLFGVRSIPAMSMIRKNGNSELAVGSMTKDQLKYWFNGLISK